MMQKRKQTLWHCCGDDCEKTNTMPYNEETNDGWQLMTWQTVPSRRGWMCHDCAVKFPEGV